MAGDSCVNCELPHERLPQSESVTAALSLGRESEFLVIAV